MELAESDVEDWTLVESSEEALPRLVARWCPSECALVLDFSGRLSGRTEGFRALDGGAAAQYAFTCSDDTGRYAEALARSLAAALNLNEEEHVALLGASRTYYSNAEAGGVISISSMLPEKSRQLELLKSKLDELTVIPPTFGAAEDVPDRAEVDLSQVAGGYARRALAYVLLAKFASDHPRSLVVAGSFEEMLPEGQTRSMRYPMEVAATFLWTLKAKGTKLVAQSRRPLPREFDGLFRTRIVEEDGRVRMKRAGGEWREVYLVNDCGGASASRTAEEEMTPDEDDEALLAVLSTVGSYSNVSFAGLISFLKGRMEEDRVQRAADHLLRKGYLEPARGPREARCLALTESGRTFLETLEAKGD